MPATRFVFRASLAAIALFGSVQSGSTFAQDNSSGSPGDSARPKHNIVLFVTDGLRSAMVDEKTAPALWHFAQRGVSFPNSHSIFPTFTMNNASVLATGHYLGDTGNVGNTLYSGFEVKADKNAVTPFLEADPVLGEMDEHFTDYLNEATLLARARRYGYGTAAIGKLGPALLLDHTERSGQHTYVIDDSTGTPDGIPLSTELTAQLNAVGLPTATPKRGDNGKSGTKVANLIQQDYFIAATTRAVLPLLVKQNKPFVLVYWSRDPDGTQHNQGDSPQQVTPGINGSTSLAAIRNVDDDFARLQAALYESGLTDSTDIVVTADHGFSTVSKESHNSPSARATYADVPAGQLPPGFLALDLAHTLKLPLLDPNDDYKAVAPGHYPKKGNGVIGRDRAHPRIIVAANGGSDLLYLFPAGDKRLATRVADFLTAQDYVSGVFADSRLGTLPAALSLKDVNLEGAALTPRPSLVVNFRSYDTGCGEPTRCAVEIADTTLQQGQGMHGALSRADTWNFTAAQGPDFKTTFADPAPVSNVDVGRTLAHLVNPTFEDKGALTGRVLEEIFTGGAVPESRSLTLQAKTASHGQRTLLKMQQVGDIKYFDAAGFEGKTVGLDPSR